MKSRGLVQVLAVLAGVGGVAFVVGVAVPITASAPVVQRSSVNPANDTLTGYSEQRRGAALRDTVIRARGKCDRANRTFHKGTAAAAVAYWSVGCVNGLSYLVQITPDDPQLIAQAVYAKAHGVPLESVPGYTTPNLIEALGQFTKTSVTDCAAYRKLSGGDCFTKF
jgi:hypothetical protein